MKDIKVQEVGGYPIIKHYMEELGIYELFQSRFSLGGQDNSLISSSLCVLIMNILMSIKPLYKISEWLKDYSDGKSEFGYEAHQYNDDVLGRSLDALFKSDRSSLLTEISLQAIKHHNLCTKEVHNDTTTVTLSGAYETVQSGVIPKQGYNKDGCPDAKQIVFGLNVLRDGHVPIHYKAYDGNTSDVDTHQANWLELKNLLNRTDFTYTADSKLATKENMAYLSENGGKFASILPASRLEVKKFKTQVKTGEVEPQWEIGLKRANSRKKGEEDVYEIYEGEKTEEGYSIYWIRSSSKRKQDAHRREEKLLKAEQELEALLPKLNKYYLKTKEKIEERLNQILKGTEDLISVQIIENKEIIQGKIGVGRISKHTQYKEEEVITYNILFQREEQAIAMDTKIDGLFPLVTNIPNTEKSPTEILTIYKEQPYLESRFSTMKSILEVAPMFLKLPRRIEAMLFLYFIALMIIALIERKIRNSMEEEKN
ncbi:MAG: IS1634 family transposase [Saprospiraceae bacterium]|nr:IS1634 family transposase [Saprospiraceae bacterium]